MNILLKSKAEVITDSFPVGSSLKFIKIEGGSFLMGSNEYDNEQPVHKVSVTDFLLAQYPVTVKTYLSFANGTQSNAPEWMEEGNEYNIYTGTDNYYKKFGTSLFADDSPIVGISWDNAKAFCHWLNQQTGKNYRLPSEAEWEYAARGGKYSNGFKYAGSNKLKEVGWYNLNSHAEMKQVGLKLPNELGIHDMSGNVWEWCEDVWHDDYKGAPKDGEPWMKGGDQSLRVVRGGSWGSNGSSCRVSLRVRNLTVGRINNFGFRLARY